jgi:hypothetical protein
MNLILGTLSFNVTKSCSFSLQYITKTTYSKLVFLIYYHAPEKERVAVYLLVGVAGQLAEL